MFNWYFEGRSENYSHRGGRGGKHRVSCSCLPAEWNVVLIVDYNRPGQDRSNSYRNQNDDQEQNNSNDGRGEYGNRRGSGGGYQNERGRGGYGGDNARRSDFRGGYRRGGGDREGKMLLGHIQYRSVLLSSRRWSFCSWWIWKLGRAEKYRQCRKQRIRQNIQWLVRLTTTSSEIRSGRQLSQYSNPERCSWIRGQPHRDTKWFLRSIAFERIGNCQIKWKYANWFQNSAGDRFQVSESRPSMPREELRRMLVSR